MFCHFFSTVVWVGWTLWGWGSVQEDGVATEQSDLKMLETDTGRRRSDARGGEARKGPPAALSWPGEHRCCCSTAPCWLVSVRLTVRVLGAALSPLLPAHPHLNVHLGFKSKSGSSAAVCFYFVHVG